MAENVTKKKLYVEGVGDVVSVVLFLVTLPVVSAAFLNVLKTLIVLIMPKRFFDKKMGYKKGTIRFDNPKRSHLTVQRNPEELPPNNFLYTTVFPMVEWIVDKIDNLAKKYIDVLVFILKKIPKMKTKNDNELRHIAITIYYTITVGLLMKVIKILLYKKGLIGDGTALKSIRDLIINGLKFGSYDLDFDDIEKDSDVIFSNKGVAPIMKELTDNFLRQFHITEDTYNHMNNNTLNETFQRHLGLLHKKLNLNENVDINQVASTLEFKPVTKQKLVYKYVEDGKPGSMEPMTYTKSKGKQDVVTTTTDGKETQNVAEEGDIIMSGATGENYVIKGAKFSKLYHGNVGGDVYPEQSPRQVALYTGGETKFKAPWGEDMVIKPGDYLVKDPANTGYYRIAKVEFEKTYNKL